ncbi:hypothetical protein [Amycolatopsis azurea]|uniref:Uncharacterized protein n=1 Tax=Amycolatopsis azurea DSM 43854 TaxID=1238180 RepID=M2PG80_9PSEU|nr:hypothetical protein [Amycolatopsis azurea]EMD23368.1 hypothetical protein C791_7292 [Amycolatopsis azurea DSM 43854]OOC06299.1 hypothetical protein B0293_12425 [Amycolatopsis azurea DSM 43854]
MTDDLGLPGRRELPPEVLDSLRMSLREGMGKPVRRRWPVFAAAAAVVLVLAGALVATVVIREPDRPGPVVANPDFSLDWPKAVAAMDRCWAAVQSGSRAASFPARDEWVPQFTVTSWEITVVAVMAGGKPLFCETTLMTATVSDPDAAPPYTHGGTAALLMTRSGTVAGVVDPEWPKLEVSGQNEASSSLRDIPVFRPGNLFVHIAPMKPSRTTYAVGPTPGEQSRPLHYRAPYLLRPAPEPAATVLDKPVFPVPDRATPAGEFFTTCTRAASEALSDDDAYEVGALLEGEDVGVVVARLGGRTIVCQGGLGYGDGKTAHYAVMYDQPKTAEPVHTLRTETVGRVDRNGVATKPQNAYLGVVPDAAVAVKLDFGTGKTIDATVAGGTFAAWFPDGVSQDYEHAKVGITVLDAAGNVLHQGTLPLW